MLMQPRSQGQTNFSGQLAEAQQRILLCGGHSMLAVNLHQPARKSSGGELFTTSDPIVYFSMSALGADQDFHIGRLQPPSHMSSMHELGPELLGLRAAGGCCATEVAYMSVSLYSSSLVMYTPGPHAFEPIYLV